MAFPSIHLLCIQDSFNSYPRSTVKITRNQWNWQRDRYDVRDHLLDERSFFDLMSSLDIPVLFRNITLNRVLVIRSDVLHSLGIPGLGVKLDSCPGRINGTIFISRHGLFLGSCYELCGRGHRAIPISFLTSYS